MRALRKPILALFVSAVTLATYPAHFTRAQTLFASITLPGGVATDPSGNVFVDMDRTYDHGIAVFEPDGTYLGYIQTGGFTAVGANYLALWSSTGKILALNTDGTLRVIDPTAFQLTVAGNVSSIPADTSHIYDVATLGYWDFGGMIDPSSSSFGDLAVYEHNGVLDLFMTGLSQAQTFPFVLRLRFEANGNVTSKVVAASSASTVGTWNGFRGVAVNRYGTVATTLPTSSTLGNIDHLVTFQADFPEASTGIPTIQLNGADVASQGMTVDAVGDFYIATGPVGTSVAGALGSGALVEISPSGSGVVDIVTLDTSLADSLDVTLSPTGDRVYMPVLGVGVVLFTGLPKSAPPVGDFNGDGTADIVFQNPTTGQLAVWFMNGSHAGGGSFITPTQTQSWKAVGVGEFNGDGNPDIVFQNATTGQLSLWYMHGVQATEGGFLTPTPPSGWKVVGVGDFNADGHPDLLLQNANTGQLAVWFMNGSAVTGATFVTPGQAPDWKAVGVGDFNGDGRPDIVFQNKNTGQLSIWYLNGVTAYGGGFITPSQPPVWRAAAIADYNGDGKPDILFQNISTGQLSVWYLDGTQAIGGAFVIPAQNTSWQVCGPR